MSTEPQQQHGELERTLGLGAALAIGVGTMVGAGIFVFPGIAAGQAGPAAMISFGTGAVIALLVALPASELATAMPQSGGAYFFVSRGLGAFPGALVGIGQWMGLVFASAFYLVGFGEYLFGVLEELGLSVGAPVTIVAVVTALLLTGINITGTQNTGTLQNIVVLSLLIILTLFLGYGVLDTFGGIGDAHLPESFAPFGGLPIATTAALVFTSYLGFVQIATVAEEVKEPGRTLPRAMVGSVIVVAVLYVITLFVATSAFPPERLNQLGETALVEVARKLVGPLGAVAILAAGLLATLSSANASILSSSRAVYALSKDELVPEQAAAASDRFQTPHIALLAAGIPIAALALVGRVELLAEVASFLHLVIYGLICIVLLVLRRREPSWYQPSFRTPGYPWIPALGALASFGLIAFMQPLSMMVGAAVLVLAALWYAVHARDVELRGVVPEPQAQATEAGAILVAVELSDPERIPAALVQRLSPTRVVLLGYRLVREQTTPEQARDAFEQQDLEMLRTITEQIAEADIEFTSHLVFTPRLTATINRLAIQEGCDAVLTPKPAAEVEQILIPVRGDPHSRLLEIVGALAPDASTKIILLHVATSEEADSEELLGSYRERLVEHGIPDDVLHLRSVQGQSPVRKIIDVAERTDLVVIGETLPSVRSFILGDVPSRIVRRAPCPVLVVRRSP